MKSFDRRMQTLRANEIHADAAIRVIAIEAVHFNTEKAGRFYRLFMRIEPTAVVICEGSGKRVIDLASAETSLEELKRNVPGLQALLG